MKKLVVNLILVFCIPLLSFSLALPKPDGAFTDTTGLLGGIEQKLEDLCRGLKEKNGCEIGVLAVDTLQGATVEEFAHEVFHSWGIGKAGKDNGVLILLAVKDRKTRIEVGYELESILPDSLAGKMLKEHAVPYFINNDWEGGLVAMTKAIADFLSANYVAADSSDVSSPAKPLSGSPENHTNEIKSHPEYQFSEFLFTVHFDSWRWGLLLILIIGFLVVNVTRFSSYQFITVSLLGVEIGSSLVFVILSFFLDFRIAGLFNFAAFGGIILFLIQFFLSLTHKCPQCGGYLKITKTVLTAATYTSKGMRRIDDKCTKCKYEKSVHETIPMLVESTSYSSSGSSDSWGGSSSDSSSSDSSFGGGDSGGGGASSDF